MSLKINDLMFQLLSMNGPLLIPHSHYSRECASVRIDAHSRIRTIHTTATMRSEAHSMSKRSEAKRSEAKRSEF